MLASIYAVAMAILVLYGVNLLFLSLVFVRYDKMRRRKTVLPRNGTSCPVVTVQVPLYNEALVAGRIIDAVAHLDYPRKCLEIQILDDSTDDSSAIIAQRVHHWQKRGVDIAHIRRAKRKGYKAGALAHGLKRSRGTFVAMFDADFVPQPDFLHRMLPAFDRPDIGMVQARWGHLNAKTSWLTRLQAFALDGHFALEQAARHAGGYFMSFNGTAGIWRRACIEDAGGWQSSTLTEDLDLSYRAQLRGWRFRFMSDIETCAELPQDINAWRAQQFRWTKGTAETAILLLRRLWRSRQPLPIKIQGTLHLTAHSVFPFLVVVTLLHAPLLIMEGAGYGPGSWYFAIMGLSLTGLMGFFLAQMLAQRALYPDWGRRILFFPMVMAGTMGMAVSNTRAIWQALRQHRTPFERTPKHTDKPWWQSRYAQRTINPATFGEALLALYSIVGLGALVWIGAWAALPFQTVFALAFTFVSCWNILQIRRTRTQIV